MKKINFDAAKDSIKGLVGKAQAKSPDIAMVLGTGLVIGGAVASGASGIKAAKVIDTHKGYRRLIFEAENTEGVEYSAMDKKFDILKLYTSTAKDLAKVYAVPIALTATGLGCFWWSHGEMGKRNAALGVAAASLRQAFDNYRENVVNEGGEELDRHYMYGTSLANVETFDLDEDGNEINKETATVEKLEQIDSDDIGNLLHQTIFCRSTSKAYTGQASFDKNFVMHQEMWANMHLQSKGFLTLDEMYDALGIEIYGRGYLKSFGWIYDKNNPGTSDFVKLNITPVYQEITSGQHEGEMEQAFLIEFNDRGYILDKI